MTFKFSEQDQTITVHHFNSEGVYLSSSELLIEANTGLPANSTIDALPETKANKVALYIENRWVVKSDHRGQTAYAKDRDNDSDFTIENIGEIPDTHTLEKPGDYDSWTESGWQYDPQRYRPVWVEQETNWQEELLTKVDAEIAKYQQDLTIPEKYSELRVTGHTEQQYHDLLKDRKLLNDYLLQADFPDCGRPTLSGLV